MPTKKSLTDYPKRGEIFIADLNPTRGREIHKKRPVLVISHNSLNKHLPTVIIVPFSSVLLRHIGLDVVVFPSQKGLPKKSVLIVNQIRAIDTARLIQKVGTVSKNKMEEVTGALNTVLGLR